MQEWTFDTKKKRKPIYDKVTFTVNIPNRLKQTKKTRQGKTVHSSVGRCFQNNKLAPISTVNIQAKTW